MLAGFIDFTLPISHHGERPFKCVTTRWYFQEHKSSGLMSECYPSTFLSGFYLERPLECYKSSSQDSSFLVLGLGSIGTGLSQVPEDTTLRRLEMRGISGLTSLGPLS